MTLLTFAIVGDHLRLFATTCDRLRTFATVVEQIGEKIFQMIIQAPNWARALPMSKSFE